MALKDYEELLTNENAKLAAKEIVEAIRVCDPKMVDYDFHVNPKTLKMLIEDEEMFDLPLEEWEPNTNFQFDTKPDSLLRSIIDMITRCEQEDEKKAKELGIEYAGTTQEEVGVMINFLIALRESLNSDELGSLKLLFRERILKQSEQDLPFERFAATHIEIDRLPDPRRPGEGNPYLLSINKLVGANQLQSAPDKSVHDDLIVRFITSGKDVNSIIDERKAAGDPLYANVMAANLRKNVFEVRVDWFVDYSMRMPEPSGTVS